MNQNRNKFMESRIIMQTNCVEQLRLPGSQITEPSSPKHSESSNSSKSDIETTNSLAAVNRTTAERAVHIRLEDKKSNNQRKVSIDVIADKVPSETVVPPKSNDTHSSSGTQKQHENSTNVNGIANLEVNGDQEKKISEKSANDSLVSSKVSDGTSRLMKSRGSAKTDEWTELVESIKSSICRPSTSSATSGERSCRSLSNSITKPHKANDSRWEAIQMIRAQDGVLSPSHFRLLKRLGCGDIGSVYLTELSGTKCHFSMKVVDKASLANRKKLLRAQTEKEILQSLDHPFLPTLFTHFETDKFSCLVMELCPGGDLHMLRQRQHGKYFSEQAVRFYVAEVLLALEYLHMLGIIYRDLKPENVLVSEDGHIMLSDFDLSLRCAVRPTLIRSSSNPESELRNNAVHCVQHICIEPSRIKSSCVAPTRCFGPHFFSSKTKEQKSRAKPKPKPVIGDQVSPLPELIVEPTDARSMSFVGTHEYLATEIIKGEGHGSAVDWWTFGIFMCELLFGKTPFKGSRNRATLFNVVGQPLRFPDSPVVSFSARDLIKGLLVKDPQHRLAYKRGATEIKQHPFFEGVNWALIRCASPPEIPKPLEIDLLARHLASTSEKFVPAINRKCSDHHLEFDFF